MKKDIHPAYSEIKVVCSSCGNSFTTGSTHGKEMHLDVCDKCHPFYTKTQRVMDTGGRVQKFQDKFAKFRKPSAEETPPAA